ncbi:MAG TPA: type II toxin-antitoxin system prevent-host-death family antitoxin [Solirubrobacterales bacterium]|jgi:antitoxin (DNA-binding transcriptional repressor) of toxin-antitoxin stability system|nr:type II toxin-antitoxin system prevent-host-death family antitoxin [Solirubrobacterales bacterium]
MTRLTATEVSRNFSRVVNRVDAGEEVEVVRNGIPIVHMRPPRGRQLVSAARWPRVDGQRAGG